jgi:hypothetical protein
MIPYEELVVALARWRARRGLPTGLGDYLGEPAPAAAGAHDFQTPPAVADHSRDDVVELGDELLDGVVEDGALGGYGEDEVAAQRAGNGESLEPMDLADLGDHPSETTRPAGLAGLAAPEVDAEPVPGEPEPGAEEQPSAKGRSRGGRRRRK